MTSAAEALLAFVSVLAILVLPGAAVAVVLRLRGFTALALTPALSVSIVGVSAVVGPVLGMTWGWWVPAVGTAVVVATLLLANHLRRRLSPSSAVGTESGTAVAGWEPAALLWGVAGAAVAAVLITVRLLLAARGLEPITQNYDTVFHLNAVHYALESGNASPWHIGAFVRPGAESPAPYPGGWHALVTLLVQLSGLSIAAATNAMWLALAALLWPASALLLTRTLVGPNPGVLAAAGVLTSAFAAFPYLLLDYGSLYPNTLSTALVPTGLALVLILLRQARSPAVSWGMAGLLTVLYLPAQVLSQPNGLFSIAFLLTPLIFMLVLSWVRTGFFISAPAGLRRSGLVLGAFAGTLALVVTNDTMQSLSSWSHPKSMPFGEALWRAAAHFPIPTWWPAPVLTGLVFWGLYRLARDDRRGWMVGSFVLIVLVYGLAIGSNNPVGNAVIAPWYGNPERLAALMPLLAVPWAAVGLERLATTVWQRIRARPVLPLAFTTLVTAALLAVASPTLWQINARLADTFSVRAPPSSTDQLDADELGLLQQLEDYLPDDAVLANNPWNGSALAPALTGRDVLFPYMTMSALDEDRALLRSDLDGIATSEQVCAAAQRLGVEYLLDFGDDLIPPADDGDGHLYPGIDRAAESEAFEPVLTVGEAKLLKLPPCTVTTP